MVVGALVVKVGVEAVALDEAAAGAGDERRREGERDGRLLGGLEESTSLEGIGACCACMDSTWLVKRSTRLVTA